MFNSQVTVEYWPTGYVWQFTVRSVTAGTAGGFQVHHQYGTGYANRTTAEKAGILAAQSLGWASPRVVHC